MGFSPESYTFMTMGRLLLNTFHVQFHAKKFSIDFSREIVQYLVKRGVKIERKQKN